MAQRILGLDIGKSAIKGVVLETTLRSYQVAAFHSEPVQAHPEDDEELQRAAMHAALHALIDKLSPIDQIISCIPGEISACTVLEFPFHEPRKIEQTLGFQLDDLSPFDLEDLHYSYQYIEKSKQESRLLVGSTHRDEFAAFLEDLQGAQVDPRILMMDGLPYYHLFQHIITPPEDPVFGVLDLGYARSTLTIFRQIEDTEENHPLRTESVRSLSRGVQHLQQAFLRQFQVDHQQAIQLLYSQTDLRHAAVTGAPQTTLFAAQAFSPILTEVRRTIASLQRRLKMPLQTLYITGGGASIPGIEEFLSQRLQVNVSRLHVPSDLPMVEDLTWPEEAQDTLFKALALAARSIQHHRYAQINLRKGPYSFKGDLQFLKERLGSMLVGAAILFVLFLASTFSQFYVLGKEKKTLNVEAENRCRQILGRTISDPNRCLLIMLEEIQKVKGSGSKAIIPKVSSYDIFLEVYDRVAKLIKEKRIKIEIGRLRISPNRFEIEGETGSYAAVDQIEQRLKSYKCFSKMKKGRVQQTTGASKKIEFRLRAAISC